MSKRSRMKNFHSRVTGHENPDGAKTWSRWIRYQLMSDKSLNVKDLTEKIYGSRSLGNQMRLRGAISTIKKPLENKTGRMLSCFRGTYSLIDHRKVKNGSRVGFAAEQLERDGRRKRTTSYFGSYHRSVEISLKHNPRSIFMIRAEMSQIDDVVRRAEKGLLKRLTSPRATQLIAKVTRRVKRAKK